MRIHPVVMVATVLLTAVVAWFVGHIGNGNDKVVSGSDESSQEEVSEPSPTHLSKPAAVPKPKMHEQVALTVENEVKPLRDVPKVEHYLRLLKQRAKEKKQVTALEVEPGMAAIRSLEPIIGGKEMLERLQSFSAEMTTLSRSFEMPPASSEQHSPSETSALLEEIENESDNELKQQAIHEYIKLADMTDDPKEHTALLSTLGQTLSRDKPNVDPPDMDSMAETIQNAENDDAKQKAIRAYLDAAVRLAPEEQKRAITRLDELAGLRK